MSRYVSDILYHMVGSRSPRDHEANFETLCRVLDSQEVRHRKLDDDGSSMMMRIDCNRAMENGELIDQTITCFCDIDQSMLHPIHTSKYGMFGVGVDRTLFAEWGGRPVSYIPVSMRDRFTWGHRFGREALSAWKALHDHFPSGWKERVVVRGEDWFPGCQQEAAENAKSLLARDVLAFLKFFDVGLKPEDPSNYYMEREWRKFGPFPLHMSLREVVVASGYKGRLMERFPELRVPVEEIGS